MVVSGIALTSSDESLFLSGLGAALASVGGALLSWSAATVQEDERAIRVFRPRLETLSRHLGTIAAQINQITVDARNETVEPTSALNLVSTTSNNLYTLVNDVQAMIGSDFDLAGIQGTISRLGELAALWSESAHGSSLTSDVSLGVEFQERFADELAEIKEQLQSAVRVGGTKRQSKETFGCPRCHLKVPLVIGLESGDTATVTCPKCRLRFNVHRNSSQRLFHRIIGEAAKPEAKNGRGTSQAEIVCTVCERKQRVDLGLDPGSTVHRSCSNCGVGLNIHRVSPEPETPALVVRDGIVSSSESLHDRYRRMLKKTGVRFVPRQILELGCQKLEAIFAKRKEHFASFQDLDEALFSLMKADDPKIILTDAKKVRQMIFKGQIFEFDSGESGSPRRIWLPEGMDADAILDRTDEQLLRRLVQQREEPLNPEAASRLLLGNLPEDNERMATIVRRINSLWDAGALKSTEEKDPSAGSVAIAADSINGASSHAANG
jgi:transposase-like protein